MSSFENLGKELLAHREVVDSSGHDDRCLLHVVLDNPFVGVEIGVPGEAVVLDAVEDRVDAGKAGIAEAGGIGSASRSSRSRRRAQACRGL